MPQNFDTLTASNPYRKNIDNYQPSFLQKLWMSLGGRTQYDAWRENMQVQADEYDAALAQKQFDTEYNDPQSQVARMKAAGLNPDIDPGSIDSGSASPMGEDPSTPMQSTGEEGIIKEVAQGVMSCFTTALGIVQSFQGIQTTHLNNLLQVADFAEQSFPNFIPYFGEDPSADVPIERSDYISNSLAMAKMFAKGNLPLRYRQRFVDTIEGFWNSAPKDEAAFKAWTSRIGSRREYAIEKENLYDEIPGLLYPMAKEIGEMQEDIFRARQSAALHDAQAETAESVNRREYAENLDSELQARAENAGNEVNYENSQMVGIMRKHLGNIIDGLESASKDGGIKGALSSVCMTLISMLQLWISSQGVPSVSRSTSFGKTGNVTRESTSINF